MFDPSSITLGQVSSSVRDFAVVGALVTVTWKSRGWFDSAKTFFERTIKHMDVMETGMQTLLTNHLAHIEVDLRSMARRHDVEPVAVDENREEEKS